MMKPWITFIALAGARVLTEQYNPTKDALAEEEVLLTLTYPEWHPFAPVLVMSEELLVPLRGLLNSQAQLREHLKNVKDVRVWNILDRLKEGIMHNIKEARAALLGLVYYYNLSGMQQIPFVNWLAGKKLKQLPWQPRESYYWNTTTLAMNLENLALLDNFLEAANVDKKLYNELTHSMTEESAKVFQKGANFGNRRILFHLLSSQSLVQPFKPLGVLSPHEYNLADRLFAHKLSETIYDTYRRLIRGKQVLLGDVSELKSVVKSSISKFGEFIRDSSDESWGEEDSDMDEDYNDSYVSNGQFLDLGIVPLLPEL